MPVSTIDCLIVGRRRRIPPHGQQQCWRLPRMFCGRVQATRPLGSPPTSRTRDCWQDCRLAAWWESACRRGSSTRTQCMRQRCTLVWRRWSRGQSSSAVWRGCCWHPRPWSSCQCRSSHTGCQSWCTGPRRHCWRRRIPLSSTLGTLRCCWRTCR